MVSPRRIAVGGLALRLGIGFALVGLISAALVAANWWLLDRMGSKFAEVLDQRVPRIALLQEVLGDLDGLQTTARDALLASDAGEAESSLARIDAGRSAVGAKIELLQKSFSDDEHETAVAGASDALANSSSGVLVSLVKFTRLARAGDRAAAQAWLKNSLDPKLQAMARTAHQFREAQVAALRAAKEESGASVHRGQQMMLVLLGGTIFVGTACSVVIVRSTRRRLDALVRYGRALAIGDLGATAGVEHDAEWGPLLDTLGDMRDRLARIVADIRTGCGEIAHGSTHITEGNRNLSERAAQQAHGVQMTGSETHELAAAVKRNADRAREATVLARTAAELAGDGQRRVAELVKSIHEVDERSSQIESITAMIDSIAFQTNILALNAAVEAARAGDSGRGFAVVASEVRALSLRSATAARDIKGLISSATREAGRSAELAAGTGRTIEEVFSAFGDVARIVESISNESTSQAHSIEKVREAIAEIDAATQQTAQLAGEVATASVSVQQQTRRLVDNVSNVNVADAMA